MLIKHWNSDILSPCSYKVCVQAKCSEHCSSIDLKLDAAAAGSLGQQYCQCQFGTIDRNNDQLKLISLFGTMQILIWYPYNWRGGTGGKRDLNYTRFFIEPTQTESSTMFFCFYQYIMLGRVRLQWREDKPALPKVRLFNICMWLFTLPNVCLIRFDVIFTSPIFISLWSMGKKCWGLL